MLKKRIKEFNERASWLKKGVLYHRGKHNNIIKENTIEAFKEAINDDLGIELDVRLTKDNKVVVSHDSNLKRVFNVDICIEDTSYEDICKATDNQVPLLIDVLGFVNDRVGIMVEIKSKKVRRLRKEVYEILKKYKGRYVIVSFNPMILRYFRKKDPLIIRGQLSHSYKNSNLIFIVKYILGNMWLNIFSKPHFISYGIDECNFKLLAKYHKKGYFIIGWTYKNEKNKEQLSKVYDNMIVENISIKEFY